MPQSSNPFDQFDAAKTATNPFDKFDKAVEQPSVPSNDYDYEGFKASGLKQGANGHYPDTFKLPNHMTFSSDSKYSKAGQEGGKWEQQGGKWSFTPSEWNLKQHPAAEMQAYFKKTEPDATLNLPQSNPFDKFDAPAGNPFDKFDAPGILGKVGHALDIRPQIAHTLETGKKAGAAALNYLPEAIGGIAGAPAGPAGVAAGVAGGHIAKEAIGSLLPTALEEGATAAGVNPTTPAGHKLVDRAALSSAFGKASMAVRPSGAGMPMKGAPATTIPGAETPPPAALAERPSELSPNNMLARLSASENTTPKGEAAAFLARSRAFETDPMIRLKGHELPAELPPDPYAGGGPPDDWTSETNPARANQLQIEGHYERASNYANDRTPGPAATVTPQMERALTSLHTDKTMRQVGKVMNTLQAVPHNTPFEGVRYIIGPDGRIHFADARSWTHDAMANEAGYEGVDRAGIRGGLLTPEQYATARGKYKTTEEFNDYLKATSLPGNMNPGRGDLGAAAVPKPPKRPVNIEDVNQVDWDRYEMAGRHHANFVEAINELGKRPREMIVAEPTLSQLAEGDPDTIATPYEERLAAEVLPRVQGEVIRSVEGPYGGICQRGLSK